MDAQLRLLTPPVDPSPAERRAIDESDEHDTPPALDPGPASWRLSDRTRALGRRGIEHAREALHRARPSAA